MEKDEAIEIPIKEKNGTFVTDQSYLERASLVSQIKELKNDSYIKMKIRPGQKILDLGCGTGEDVLDIAKMVGNTGNVVGIDVNDEIIKTAQSKLLPEMKNIEFICQNAETLPFKDDYFDSSRSDRVFQHLKNYNQVFSEMIRVTKKGGKILVLDPDWESTMINSSNKKVTRTILLRLTEFIQNCWIGRNLPSMFKEHNLSEINVESKVFNMYDFKTANQLMMLDKLTNILVSENKITEQEAKGWLNELIEKDKKGLFYAGLAGFIVTGVK